MKKLVVISKCDGCGICTVQCPDYLRENDEGNAEVIEGKFVQEKDVTAIQRLITRCPRGAIYLDGAGHTQKKGIEGLKEIITWLETEKDKIHVEKVPTLHFNAKEYQISVPSSNKEYDYDYSSEFEARVAAENEFERLCYSEAAYKPVLKKIFIEYKVSKLKPYYLCADIPESAYYRYNESMRKLLADAYGEIQSVMDGKVALPEKWNTVCIYPVETSYYIKELKEFGDSDVYLMQSVIDNFNSRGEYTKLRYYIDLMDFDERGEYRGKGLFGSKYKKKYRFRGFYHAAREFVDDLKHSCDMVSGFEDMVTEAAQHIMQDFEKALKLAMEERILTLKELCEKVNAPKPDDDFNGYAKHLERILGPSRSNLYMNFDRNAESMEGDFIGVRMSDTREPEKLTKHSQENPNVHTIRVGF